MFEAPKWVGDNPFIKRILSIFIDQCDKPNTIRYQKTINRKSAPELFDYEHVENQYLWPLVEQKLYQEFSIIERIQYGRVALNAEKYEKAILYFNRSSEELVRGWLNRPIQQSYALEWHAALDLHPQFRSTSLNQAIPIKGVKASKILAGFARVEQELLVLSAIDEKISLRGLSARCFWGDSKFLDNRRDLIEHAFELSIKVVVPRAIMLSAYIPLKLEELVFIENFDSFIATVNAIKSSPKANNTAVVYSAGYRSSASLIRSVGHCQFVCINSVEDTVFETFYQWWFEQSEREVKTYFWGDLDYEGMRILKSLGNQFPHTSAWKLAYDMMLNYHQIGLGHAPSEANKQAQLAPQLSGCEYADDKLIPLLLSSQRFIDQEVVSQAQLQKALNLTD